MIFGKSSWRCKPVKVAGDCDFASILSNDRMIEPANLKDDQSR